MQLIIVARVQYISSDKSFARVRARARDMQQLVVVVALFVLLPLAAFDFGNVAAKSRHRREAADDDEDEQNERSHRKKNFGYDDPDKWSEEYPVCSGVRQSPINIELQDVETMDTWRPPLGRFGYDAKPLEMSITNNGHSVQLTGVWPTHDTPSVYGGPLTGLYQLAQVHFHWGAENDVGSEHTVANHSFPLEMHMVHWKKVYQNLSEAVNHHDGLVVLGYLMSLDKSANMGIESIRSSFSSILKPGESTQIEPFPLSLFDLDLIKEGYVTYLGSLTTPPCSESVIWLISVRIKDVTIDELESFRKLHLHNDDKSNYRPTQPRNSRSIYYLYNIPS